MEDVGDWAGGDQQNSWGPWQPASECAIVYVSVQAQ